MNEIFEMTYVYDFTESHRLENPTLLLGNKGANLAGMASLGLPVPPGFILTTQACQEYEKNQKLSDTLKSEVLAHLEKLGKQLGRSFNQAENPLLVSVRSGASVSMPGMMETLLNVGLTPDTLPGFSDFLGQSQAALDCYRRFLQMYGHIVLGLSSEIFQNQLQSKLEQTKTSHEKDLSEEHLKSLILVYENLIQTSLGLPLSTNPYDHLWGSIEAVFKSWNSPRAKTYRQLQGISDTLGTAITIQAMVFGNLDKKSASGVAFTRNPSTGEKELFGEYLVKAQGEDVVAGTHTPDSLNDGPKSLATLMPDTYQHLQKIGGLLEKHYKDMQDLEFTIEKGHLWMLQTRTGKRSAKASVRIAVEMVEEKLLTPAEALLKINPDDLERLLLPCLDSNVSASAFVEGFAGAPGAATGSIVFTAEDAVNAQAEGKAVILVRPETNADDVHGIWAAAGVLTQRGGTTSHAAVVARGMGKPCIVGASALEILSETTLRVGSVLLQEGNIITLDGNTGKAYEGDLPKAQPHLGSEINTALKWADQYRHLGVRANAETRQDVLKALELGAEGIGLCRTEHMFFDPKSLRAFQQMILSKTPKERRSAIEALLPLQKESFKDLFEVLDAKPVTIRFLDPPLHEFLPTSESDLAELARTLDIPLAELKQRHKSLQELNPMLGHRGCRLAATIPALYEMQARAIFYAAADVQKKGIKVNLELMVPLIVTSQEMSYIKTLIDTAHTDIEKETGMTLPYTYGCMIETPRAALRSDDIAQTADFFSFGTNDLTQLVYGLSRDDFAPFWPHYAEKELFPKNPFMHLDEQGVGDLIHKAVKKGRTTSPTLKIGICGEHGGDPTSIHFFHKAGLDYVSCSPYRVLSARLAAAQAALMASK
tara:strand:- start:553 stop:3195 length:2643 start_codon:yes stop_codon:yes gene_type:complete